MHKVWGEENVPENALSRKFLGPSKKKASGLLCRGFLYRKNRACALTPEGGGQRTVRGGVQNPFLGGMSFVRFSSPLFFPPPPWRPLTQSHISSSCELQPLNRNFPRTSFCRNPSGIQTDFLLNFGVHAVFKKLRN